jgi:hypothetical protein
MLRLAAIMTIALVALACDGPRESSSSRDAAASTSTTPAAGDQHRADPPSDTAAPSSAAPDAATDATDCADLWKTGLTLHQGTQTTEWKAFAHDGEAREPVTSDCAAVLGLDPSWSAITAPLPDLASYEITQGDATLLTRCPIAFEAFDVQEPPKCPSCVLRPDGDNSHCKCIPGGTRTAYKSKWQVCARTQ